MNLHIFTLTLGQILGQRRTLLMLLIAALPVLLVGITRVVGETATPPPQFFGEAMEDMVIGLVLPLVALIFGTSALGQEIEDGTVVYLLAKPLPRWRIVAEKVLAAWLVTATVLVASIVAAGLIVLLGESGYRMIPAFAVAVMFGAAGYIALFVCLSVMYSRALIIGLVYVFVWESLLTQLFSSLEYLSVREFTLGVADALAGTAPRTFDAALGPVPSLALVVATTALSIVYGTRRLSSLEIGERT